MDDVDTTAGFDLLTRFQESWHKQHCKSEKNVAKAEKVLKIWEKFEQETRRRKQVLDSFLKLGTNSFNDLTKSIQEIEFDMKQLSHQFSEIEQMLTVLQNHNENLATKLFEEEQASLQVKHLEYKSREFELTKSRLEQEHLARVRNYELIQQANIDERRRLYEKAFEEEMVRYQQQCKPNAP